MREGGKGSFETVCRGLVAWLLLCACIGRNIKSQSHLGHFFYFYFHGLWDFCTSKIITFSIIVFDPNSCEILHWNKSNEEKEKSRWYFICAFYLVYIGHWTSLRQISDTCTIKILKRSIKLRPSSKISCINMSYVSYLEL